MGHQCMVSFKMSLMVKVAPHDYVDIHLFWRIITFKKCPEPIGQSSSPNLSNTKRGKFFFSRRPSLNRSILFSQKVASILDFNFADSRLLGWYIKLQILPGW